MFVDGSTRQKPFQILLHFRASAQKVFKLKPESQIRHNPLFFPLFPVPKPPFKHHIKQIRNAPKKRGSIFRNPFFANRERLYRNAEGKNSER